MFNNSDFFIQNLPSKINSQVINYIFALFLLLIVTYLLSKITKMLANICKMQKQ